MKKQPKVLAIAKLEVLIMGNGEILCLGKTVGWFEDFSECLTDARDGVTGRLLEEDE